MTEFGGGQRSITAEVKAQTQSVINILSKIWEGSDELKSTENKLILKKLAILAPLHIRIELFKIICKDFGIKIMKIESGQDDQESIIPASKDFSKNFKKI